MYFQSVIVRPVHHSEEPLFQEMMQAHHYLGALPKIGNTLWYVATMPIRMLNKTHFYGIMPRI